jgi:hypothetical protein
MRRESGKLRPYFGTIIRKTKLFSERHLKNATLMNVAPNEEATAENGLKERSNTSSSQPEGDLTTS